VQAYCTKFAYGVAAYTTPAAATPNRGAAGSDGAATSTSTEITFAGAEAGAVRA
jgi:hypothetical protein